MGKNNHQKNLPHTTQRKGKVLLGDHTSGKGIALHQTYNCAVFFDYINALSSHGNGQGKPGRVQEVTFPPLIAIMQSPFLSQISFQQHPVELGEAACSFIFPRTKLPLKQTSKLPCKGDTASQLTIKTLQQDPHVCRKSKKLHFSPVKILAPPLRSKNAESKQALLFKKRRVQSKKFVLKPM